MKKSLKLTVCSAAIILTMIFLNAHAYSDKDILFYCSFDNTLKPSICKGSSEVFNTGKFSFASGKNKQAVRLGESGSLLAYSAPKNLNPQGGTIAFWAKNVNWEPLGKDSTLRIYSLFNYMFRHNGMTLKIHSRKEFANLIFGIRTTLEKFSYKSTTLNSRIHDKWRPGKWGHFAISWDFTGSGKIALYFNGKLIHVQENTKFRRNPFFGKLADRFYIGPQVQTKISRQTGVPAKYQPSKAITLLKDFFIFRRPLNNMEINSLAGIETKSVADNFICLPQAEKPPIVDGKIDLNEWKQAIAVSGLLSLKYRKFSQIPIKFMTARDRKGIYFSFIIPAKKDGKFLAKYHERDGKIYFDDSVEIWIVPNDGKSRQLIVNSIGGIFDAKAGQTDWNAKLKYCWNVDDKAWTGEIFIPWSENDLNAPVSGTKWKLNFCYTNHPAPGVTNCYTWAQILKGGFNNKKYFNTIKFTDSGPFLQVNNLELSPDGKIKTVFSGLNLKNTQTAIVKFIISEPGIKMDLSAVEAQISGKYLEKQVQMNLTPGKVATLSFSKQLNDSKFSKFRIITTDRKTGEKLLDLSYPFEIRAGLQLKVKTFPSEEIIKLEFYDYTWDEKIIKNAIAVLQLKDIAGKIIAKRQIKLLKPESQQIELSFTGCQPGQYKLQLEIIGKDGKRLGVRTVPWKRQKLFKKWRLGKGTVPKPFTPIKISGRKVEITNRIYDFSNGFLPMQFTSKGIDLLAAPVRMLAGFKDKTVSAVCSKFSWIKTAKDQVTFDASGKLGKPIELTASGRIDFDGFLWIEMQLHAKNPIKLENLYLEIPFKPELVPYLTRTTGMPGGSGENYYGKTPNLPFKFFPFVWMGDLEKGLTWCAESPENWRNRDLQKSIEVISRNSAKILRLRLIDKPLLVSGKLTYRFGFQATPVKSLPKQWWCDYFMSSNPKRSSLYSRPELIPNRLITSWHILWKPKGLSRVIGNWDQKGMEHIKAEVKSAKGKGRKRIFPWIQYSAADYAPYHDYYKDEWMTVPLLYMPSASVYHIIPGHFRVCPQSTWKDALGAYCRKNLEVLGYNGIYFDTGGTFLCANASHGCGYIDEKGVRQRSTPLVAAHDFMRDLYRTGKAINPDFYLLSLTNGSIATPLVSFDDAILSGEEWNHKFNDDYTKLFSLDVWKLKFNPHPWGFVNIALPARGISGNNTARRNHFKKNLIISETFFTYALLSGIPVWVAYLNDNYVEKVLNALHVWGIRKHNTKFFPYYMKKTDIKIAPEKPFSYFIRNNNILVVVANLEGKEQTFTLSSKTGNITTVKDQLTGKNINVSGNVVTVTVPPKNFILVALSVEK